MHHGEQKRLDQLSPLISMASSRGEELISETTCRGDWPEGTPVDLLHLYGTLLPPPAQLVKCKKGTDR